MKAYKAVSGSLALCEDEAKSDLVLSNGSPVLFSSKEAAEKSASEFDVTIVEVEVEAEA